MLHPKGWWGREGRQKYRNGKTLTKHTLFHIVADLCLSYFLLTDWSDLGTTALSDLCHQFHEAVLFWILYRYKPVDNKLIWLPLRESFEELFAQTFSRKQNQTFLGHIQTCYRQNHWHKLLKLMQHVYKSAINKEVKENASGKTSVNYEVFQTCLWTHFLFKVSGKD